MSSSDDDLEAIRKKKMAQFLNIKKQQEAQKDIGRDFAFKKDLVLKALFQPDAWAYLEQIRKNNPMVAQQIVNEFITPQVEMQLDLLMALLAQGRIRQQVVPIDDVQYLERQILGVKSKIQVKRRGEKEAVDLSAFLKSDE
jgi:DNA-binding TFAR19-related protein (PDSD5 family)